MRERVGRVSLRGQVGETRLETWKASSKEKKVKEEVKMKEEIRIRQRDGKE